MPAMTKAHSATMEGHFKDEIMTVSGLDKDGNTIECINDEPIRPGITREGLDSLKVLPGTDWMTAGLSSTVTDGASAMVLMSGEKVNSLASLPWHGLWPVPWWAQIPSSCSPAPSP